MSHNYPNMIYRPEALFSAIKSLRLGAWGPGLSIQALDSNADGPSPHSQAHP